MAMMKKMGNGSNDQTVSGIHSSMLDNTETIRMSPKVELAVIGGLGLFIYAAPTMVNFIGQKLQLMKTRLILVKECLGQAEIARKLDMLNRKRKTGSMIRVIAYLLPDKMFASPARIYILKPECTSYQTPMMAMTSNLNLPSENYAGDGVIEAFELNSEEMSSISGTEDDDDGASSTPEGWTQDLPNFNPTMNVTNLSFARCSTPKVNKKRDLFSKSEKHNDSKLEEEVHELKKMVATLISFHKLQDQSNVQALLTSIPQLQSNSIPTQITNPANNNATSINLKEIVVPAQSIPKAGPPPPPPPPPPMPPMPVAGNNKLVIVKKSEQKKLTQKPPMSLSDVLKELPNAKLKRVERSPGGTPIKPQLKLANQGEPLDYMDQLASALKKRFDSMHSPRCDSDLDKENVNGSDDSFDDDSPVPPKRTLFPKSSRSPQKRRSDGKLEKRLPFGQHLLKRRGTDSPLSTSPFREQNNI